MNIFDELDNQYNEIDQFYSALEFKAASRRWLRKEQHYKRQRKINDQAYFLFMFSRLEDRIREESAQLIRSKQSAIASWKQRAPWDLLPDQPDADLYFKSRLGLLCCRTSRDFNLVVTYYKERNAIAHGGVFTNPISMPTVILDMKRLYRILKTYA